MTMQMLTGNHGLVFINAAHVAAVTPAATKPTDIGGKPCNGEWSKVHLWGGGSVTVAGDAREIAAQLDAGRTSDSRVVDNREEDPGDQSKSSQGNNG